LDFAVRVGELVCDFRGAVSYGEDAEIKIKVKECRIEAEEPGTEGSSGTCKFLFGK
jgi:hypothetical protein